MHSLIQVVSGYLEDSGFTAFCLDAALKSFLVLVLAGAVCLSWRRASAATRHLIWFVAVASLPCLPLLSFLLPAWQRPLWTVSTGFSAGNQFSMAIEFAPTTDRGLSGGQTQAPAVPPLLSGGRGVQSGRIQRIATRFDASWLVLAFVIWAGGVLLALCSLAKARMGLRRFAREAQFPQSAEWPALLNELCEALRIRRPVILLQSADKAMPMTWGWREPVILLPAEADQWSAERRRIVLQHELAHAKRWDCLTQMITRIVCVFYWCNPLVWLASRRMCIERERACDDLVLNSGCRASDYASHLVEIARSFRRVPQVAGIAMARSSGLERRIAAIVDASRARRLSPMTVLAVLIIIGGPIFCVGGCKTATTQSVAANSQALRQQQIARLQSFSTAKEEQSLALAAKAGEQFFPGFRPFFDAAIKGDWQTVTNLYESFKRRHPQYEKSTGDIPHVIHWSPVLEISLAYDFVVNCDPKYTQIAVDDMINSIPAGSIYFGGTDPGRGLPTAFCRSHVDADPFFTLTQNALADSTYLTYLRNTYGARIYIPTGEDLQKCFENYIQEATQRLHNHQLKPGENVVGDKSSGRIEISGQVAVMEINGLLTKIIFDKNPDHEYYIEESFPLDWMYPYLEPHGLIMKLNRQPLPELSDEVVRQDRDYWSRRVADMIGDWLTEETPVQKVAHFAEKTYVRKDLKGFKGDLGFIQNNYAQECFSKWRSSIAGVYAWRVDHAVNEADRTRMAREADYAFRQAFILCPYSPEAVYRYRDFLTKQKRVPDAILMAETAAHMPLPPERAGDSAKFRQLVQQLRALPPAK